MALWYTNYQRREWRLEREENFTSRGGLSSCSAGPPWLPHPIPHISKTTRNKQKSATACAIKGPCLLRELKRSQKQHYYRAPRSPSSLVCQWTCPPAPSHHTRPPRPSLCDHWSDVCAPTRALFPIMQLDVDKHQVTLFTTHHKTGYAFHVRNRKWIALDRPESAINFLPRGGALSADTSSLATARWWWH